MAKKQAKKVRHHLGMLITRKRVWDDGYVEAGHLTERMDDIVELLLDRIIQLEAALDFYAWGPGLKGELEPMRGGEYVKAIAKDGGRIARVYLKERIDRNFFGAAHKDAPGGWGVDGYFAPRPKRRE